MVPLASSPGHTLLPRLVAWDMGTGKTRNGNEETGNGKWEMGNEKQAYNVEITAFAGTDLYKL